MRIPSVYRKLYKIARKQGWTVGVASGDHLCWRSPSGRKVFSSSTPRARQSDAHRRELRKAGLKG